MKNKSNLYKKEKSRKQSIYIDGIHNGKTLTYRIKRFLTYLNYLPITHTILTSILVFVLTPTFVMLIAFAISTVHPKILAVDITSYPIKTNYVEGESFDPSGMVVTVIYADGTTSVTNDYSYSDLTGTGTVEVYIIYGNYYDTVTVNVEPAKSNEVSVVDFTTSNFFAVI